MAPVFHYLAIPARGEATRVALAVAGVDFEDKRMSFEEFGASKFKTCPVYELDGTEYTQSTALLRYAGKLGGTYPEDALEALKVDEIVMILEDVFINIFSTVGMTDEVAQLEKRKALMAGKVKELLEDVARKADANECSAFCVGESLTIADIMLHAVVATCQADFLTGIPTTMVEDICPSLKVVEDAVVEHPKVRAYYYASKA
uniref:Glutathione s-transferase 1 n=1 Tax=Macrocystis pyrifera TaxID=35122 RepID=A0A9E7VH61_MACPY|nr:glutathione s-transferase 1 [Macrocystis pyrifera]